MMNNLEWLTKREAESLSLSDFVRAARRTLEELYEKKSRLKSNPPVSGILYLTSEDRKFLRKMKIKIDLDTAI